MSEVGRAGEKRCVVMKKKRSMSDKNLHPILNSLIVRGIVEWDSDEYNWVGVASDGHTVLLGHDSDSAESYLSTHPNPSDW